MEYQKKKNSPMGIIMSSPALKKQMIDAWYAPAGSTKRAQSRAAARAIIKIGQRKGIYDGQGGFADSVSNFFTTPFASAADTKTTAPRRLGSYTADEVNYKSNQEPGMLERAGSRYSSAFGKVADTFTSGWTGPVRALGTSAKEAVSMVKDLPSGFMKSIDSILHSDISGGIGELLVGELSKGISGAPATAEEKKTLSGKSAKEVADYYRTKATENKYTPPNLPSPVAPGTVVVTEEQQSGDTGSQAITNQQKTVMEHMAALFNTDRAGYLASLDENGKAVATKMLEYLDSGFSKDMAVAATMNDIDMLKKMFPGVPADKLPIGAFASEAIYNARQAMMKQFDLKGQYDKLFDMKTRGYSLEQDMIDYIKAQDSYVGTLDQLIKRETNKRGTGVGMSDVRQSQSDMYMTWLTKMKGKQEGRYIDWIEKSTRAYEASYNIAKDTFDKTSAWIDSELAALEPVTKEKYEMYQKYISGMYDQLGLMTTNSENYMAALGSKMTTAGSVVDGISKMDSALKNYPETQAAFRAATGLDGEQIGSSGLTFGYSAEQLDAMKHDYDKIRGLYGDYDKKTGDMTVNETNPVRAIENGISVGLHPDSTFKWWLEDNSKRIYGIVRSAVEGGADSDFGNGILNQYEDIMKEIKESPDYATNIDKQKIVQSMNSMLYEQYFAALRGSLFDGSDEKKEGATAKRTQIAKFARNLSKLDPNDLLLPDGSINGAMKNEALDPGIFSIGVDLKDSRYGDITKLMDQIWSAFTHWLKQGADFGTPPEDIKEQIKNIIPTVNKETGEAMTDDEIVGNLLYLMKDLYERDASLYDEYRKAEIIAGEATGN